MNSLRLSTAHMDIDQIRLANLHLLIKACDGQRKFGERVGISNPAQISQWITQAPSASGKPRALSTAMARRIEKAYPLRPGWMDTPHEENESVTYYGKDANPSRYRITEATDGTPAIAINISDARGSCGGGTVLDSIETRVPLFKESSWFRRYKVKPDDVLAVWADGDSMSEFIVDGDIVFFDTSKREPQSGVIFLIDHPDGLRIKVLRREIDGSWILESKNDDKRRYPNERITADQAELLKICGRFFYRQGG